MAVRQTEYQYLWVLGAVCPETGHAEGLLSPQLNTKIVNLFLEQFSRTLAADEHAAMIWDGAGFLPTMAEIRQPELWVARMDHHDGRVPVATAGVAR